MVEELYEFQSDRCEYEGTCYTERSISIRNLLGATIIWSSLYVTLRLYTRYESEHISRIVALLHALMVIFVGGYLCLLRIGPNFAATNYERSTSGHDTLLMLSFGYFAYDLAYCLHEGKETLLMILHHVYSVTALLRILISGRQGTMVCCTFAFLELTNPLLQMRWFIRSAGYGKSLSFYVVESIFIFSFITIRGIYGTYLLIQVLYTPGIDVEMRVQVILIYVISLGFIYNIFKYIYMKYIRSKPVRYTSTPSITRSPLVSEHENADISSKSVNTSQENKFPSIPSFPSVSPSAETKMQ